jgi:hypothetical protein
MQHPRMPRNCGGERSLYAVGCSFYTGRACNIYRDDGGKSRAGRPVMQQQQQVQPKDISRYP